MRRIAGLILFLTVLLLSGCATDKRSDALSRTMIEYANAVRWDGFEAAERFVDPKVRNAHPLTDLDLARFKQVQVSDYDDGNGPIPVSPNEIRQVVHISLTNIHTQSVRTIVDHQTWHYDQEKNHWWLETGLPDITQGSD
ncbi:hypothetical protein [Dyella mobilis]|uniref:Lipoprotein n=1 Tax=Dyella mobilis TaxID=1849582 RepID=A0ABS2KDC7_9GAMM|nr:hypothetical protein [Dyella mobilis]MBM7129183.1 hypothetical protein [Dyella mobilis]GLQ98477.1 hypothetical protein GCM10007863_28970 [Dyella mobilis]